MRRSRQSRQPPSIHLSSMALSLSWSLSSSRRRPVVCGPRRSAAIGPCGLARGLSPLSSRTGHCPHCVAVALRWRARGACNGGSLCGHIAHTHDRSLATAIIALHSPRAPTVLGSIAARHSGCDLRHRLSQTAAVRHIDRACIRFFKLRARAAAGAPRPRRHAVWPRGARIECVTGRPDGRGARGTWTMDVRKLDAAGTKRDHQRRRHVGIFLYSDTRKLLSSDNALSNFYQTTIRGISSSA